MSLCASEFTSILDVEILCQAMLTVSRFYFHNLCTDMSGLYLT